MTAVAFPIPDEVIAVADGVEGVLHREVFPRHQRDHALLFDPRGAYSEDGRYVHAVVDHNRGVRMAAARLVTTRCQSLRNWAGLKWARLPTSASGSVSIVSVAVKTGWEPVYE